MIEKYKRRGKRYIEQSKIIESKSLRLAKVKFALIFLALVQSVICFDRKWYIVGVTIFIVLSIVYIFVEKQQRQLKSFQKDLDYLGRINLQGLKRFNGKWRKFNDNGSDLEEFNHGYAMDLDIIGQDSLFQWINMCETPWGRKSLSKRLLHPLESIEEIKLTQEAIKELAGKISFRHRLKLETIKLHSKEKEISQLVRWSTIKYPIFSKTWFVTSARLLPVLTIASSLLGYSFHLIPSIVPTLLIIIQGAFLFGQRKITGEYLESVYKANKSLEKLNGVLELLEKHKHQSSLLEALRMSMIVEGKDLPSIQVKALAKISANISNRRSALYILLNLFLLWDFQCAISLEKWKEGSGDYLKDWFHVVGEFESLSSIALLKANNSDWIMPSFEKDDSDTYIKARSIGHPLIGEDCITNSIDFNKDKPVALITGSNMSGKSTFLRTIGINLVLAYIGAPVCASEFSARYMKVRTCMRISDDLANNISSFYGELLRIKMITDEVAHSKKVFFLLDEIFKGTNSTDRHTAAKAVIHNLNSKGAVGLVSTHDLELDILEEESQGQIVNYHFEENYKNEKIQFDYTLKPGVSTTRNAIFLIKATGIDMDVKFL